MTQQTGLTKDARIETLPKWAQREIYMLQGKVADLAERLSVGPQDSNVFANPYSDSPTPLGRDVAVDFRIGPGWKHRLTVRIEGNRLTILGGDGIVVLPRSSNFVEIGVAR